LTQGVQQIKNKNTNLKSPV